jgi:methionine sulfoxide reductase heme-binding subunit
MAQKKLGKLDWLQPAVLTGCIVPFAWLAWRAARGGLGANPIATVLNQLGLLALVFLWASLACTPIKIVSGAKWPIRLRKTLGLAAFFCALSHFAVYVVLDQQLAFRQLLQDVVSRPFIAVGLAALLTMLPLALTSTKRALQRMGPKRWQRLHRLAYVAAILGAAHYVLRVKKDLTEPALYAAALTVFFGVRVLEWIVERRKATSVPADT